jgi:hypothetical protein
MESHFGPGENLPPSPIGATAALLGDLLEKERLKKLGKSGSQMPN